MDYFCLNIAVNNMCGLCNQLYAITGCIQYCISKGIRKLIVNRFLKEIKTEDKCLLSEIIDIIKFNLFLEKYNVKVIPVDETYCKNITFSSSPILYKGNSNNESEYIDILINIPFLEKYTNISNKQINFEIFNVIHLRLEEDAIDTFSKELMVHRDVYQRINEDRYIECIDKYINKDITTIVLCNEKDNRVIDFLRDNNYKFMLTKKYFDKRELNALVDLNIGMKCNNVFIGSYESTFSYTIVCKLLKNKNSKSKFYSCLISLNNYDDNFLYNAI